MSTVEANDDKVTVDSYGKMDASQSGKECWMLRIPPNLASAWDECQPGSVLGELVFRKGSCGKVASAKKLKPSLEIFVDPSVANNKEKHDRAGGKTQKLPLHYSLQAMTKKLPSLHAFSRNPNGSVKIHGKISRTANLQVVQDKTYRAFCKDRILSNTVKKQRFVKPIDSNQVVQRSKSNGSNMNKNKHMSTSTNSFAKKGFGDAVHMFGKRLLESQQQQASRDNGAKKARRFAPDEPVKSIVFQLYEDKPFWTTKDLRVASGGKTENEIKKVLQEIAIYHRSGEHKTCWELKKEYQGLSGKKEND